MNPFPDYSAAYVIVRTSAGREGYGLAFTVGRGNDVQVAAIRALAPLVIGRPEALGLLRDARAGREEREAEHEHFVEPARIAGGHYVAPRAPGAGAQMHPESVT